MMNFRKIWRAMGRLFLVLGGLALLVGALNYFIDLRWRSGDHHWVAETSDADGGRYLAKYAYVNREWVYLRIYERGKTRVLAERLYYSGDRAKLYWSTTDVAYNSAGNDFPYNGIIQLPPTKLDQWLAYLP